MRPHGKARIDPNNPQRTALCMRCGTIFNLVDLAAQRRWAGQALVDTGFRVCPSCLDEPNPQERTIIVPPDPPPSPYALQNSFALDMVTNWTITPPPGANMFQAGAAFNASLYQKPGGFKTVSGSMSATASMTSGASYKAHPVASFPSTASMIGAATVQRGLGYGIAAVNDEDYACVEAPGKPTPLSAKLQIIFGGG